MAMLYTLESMYTPYQMGHDQTYVGTMLAKDRDPTLYLRDYAFHDDTLYRSYIPVNSLAFREIKSADRQF